MAERDIPCADSIPSLLYVEKKGKSRGYREDLIAQEIPADVNKFIFCSQCKAISREPKFHDGKTFCAYCSTDASWTVDARVEESVVELKCRCPLSTRGCDWSGQLGHIENHMSVCDKLRIECVMGCGEVLLKCDTQDHQELCPLRVEQCEQCGRDIQACEANKHITLCDVHPEGEVICPYKEVGCDVTGLQRRNLYTHLSDNLIGHQKLMLVEMNDLRRENERLRDKCEKKECETSKNIQYLKRRVENIRKNAWIVFSLTVIGIAVFLCLLMSANDSIRSNEQSIQSHEQSIHIHEWSLQSNRRLIESTECSIQSHEQSIQSNTQSIQSNKLSIVSNGKSIITNEQSIESNERFILSNEQSIQSNTESIKTNEQSIESNKQSIQSSVLSIEMLFSLTNTTFLNDYVEDRNTTLRGIEWTHENVIGETIYGPIFYLGKYRLRLRVWIYKSFQYSDKSYANYFVTRLKGDYDDVSDTCYIAYMHLYNVDMRDNSQYNVNNKAVSKKLKVGDEYWIDNDFLMYNDITISTIIFRIYFDFK